VAQRTGAKRFLAPAAKTASAGILLALAVAVLALAGCGGGSAADQTAASTSGASAADGSAGAAGGASPSGQTADSGQAGQAGGSPSAQSAPGAPGSSGSAAAPGGGASAGQGQKHGPRIAAPKGPVEQAPSPKQVSEATVADMSLQSPAIVAAAGHLGRLDATYTCDGDNSWPKLTWGGVPAGTAELALFVMNVQPVGEQIFFDWALAGIDPGLGEIGAAKLPKGAVVGTNSAGKVGYSLCPPGPGETYMLALYALPRSLSPKRGFDAPALRKEVLDASGNVGLLPAVYERG
jgi:phosphatidylethanolamine-binding protein (PEBP) family uncharacterized protein